MLNTFDPSDLICFATVALKIASKKGYLVMLDKGNKKRNYFALFGNLLYSFLKESEPSSLNGLYFLESSTLKINIHGSAESQEYILTITLLGGKTVIFTSSVMQEVQSWMETIESAKFIFMSRKLEDNESSSIQLTHRVEQQDIALHSLEMLLQESKNTITNLLKANDDLKGQLTAANSQIGDMKISLKENEAERLILLKSRGVVPKVLPLWALGEHPRAG
jgi:chromosome segregation ATPase